jgi:hypothetical protein
VHGNRSWADAKIIGSQLSAKIAALGGLVFDAVNERYPALGSLWQDLI